MAKTEVPGLLVAKRGEASCAMFDMGGQPILIRPTQGQRLGTIVSKDSRVAREHGYLFEPLVLQVEYGDEIPAGHAFD
jgi:hypothetical protein